MKRYDFIPYLVTLALGIWVWRPFLILTPLALVYLFVRIVLYFEEKDRRETS